MVKNEGGYELSRKRGKWKREHHPPVKESCGVELTKGVEKTAEARRGAGSRAS